MVKHNNVVPNQHFRKLWYKYVQTTLDQPAAKHRRRLARDARSKALAPRPTEALRPAVRGNTKKYNTKVREGRGFTLAELKAAGILAKTARTVGIAVDVRRRNKSEEAFQQNVQRLKLYKSKLVVFPRNSTSKRVKKGDASKAECKAASQQVVAAVAPLPKVSLRIKARKITAAEKDDKVAAKLRKAFTDAKLIGVREKRAKDKVEAAKKPKAAAASEDMGDE